MRARAKLSLRTVAFVLALAGPSDAQQPAAEQPGESSSGRRHVVAIGSDFARFEVPAWLGESDAVESVGSHRVPTVGGTTLDAELRVGEGSGRALLERLYAAARREVAVIDYARVRADQGWFVVTGYNGARGWYRRTQIRNDTAATFTFTFDQREVPKFEAAITVMSRSLQLVGPGADVAAATPANGAPPPVPADGPERPDTDAPTSAGPVAPSTEPRVAVRDEPAPPPSSGTEPAAAGRTFQGTFQSSTSLLGATTLLTVAADRVEWKVERSGRIARCLAALPPTPERVRFELSRLRWSCDDEGRSPRATLAWDGAARTWTLAENGDRLVLRRGSSEEGGVSAPGSGAAEDGGASTFRGALGVATVALLGGAGWLALRRVRDRGVRPGIVPTLQGTSAPPPPARPAVLSAPHPVVPEAQRPSRAAHPSLHPAPEHAVSRAKLVNTSYDKFKNTTTFEHVEPLKIGEYSRSLGAVGGRRYYNLYGQLRRVQSPDLDAVVLDVSYSGDDWFFLRSGAITVNVDAENTRVEPLDDGDSDTSTTGESVSCREHISYRLPDGLFEAVCEAREVAVRVEGDSSRHDLSPTECRAFQAYCRQFYHAAFDPTRYAAEAAENVTRARSGCFVATACMGDAEAPEVVTLRRFRDAALEPHRAGRAFVRAYYRVGPGWAARLERSPRARAVVRQMLIRPLARWADQLV